MDDEMIEIFNNNMLTNFQAKKFRKTRTFLFNSGKTLPNFGIRNLKLNR